ncbi:MAG: hypothetical protein WEE89_11645 [Gemmatimonadota bacterium]
MNIIAPEVQTRAVVRSLRQPRLPRVFQQQLKLIHQAGGSSLGMLVMGGAAVLFLGMDPRIAKLAFPHDYLPLTGMLLGALAFPPLVWRGQGPRHRNYHRVLPVDQLTHDLLKIAAGAVYLMLSVALVLIPVLVAALMSPVSGLVTDPSMLVWLNFFTGPLIVYLLVSCVPMLTDRPLEWMVGLTASFVGITVLADSYGVIPVEGLIDLVMRGPFGLMVALNGAYVMQPWLRYAGLSASGHNPEYGAWIFATILWLGIGITAVCLASNFVNSRKSA